jgi:soluble P-type ATPase
MLIHFSSLQKEGDNFTILVASADKNGPLSGQAALKNQPNLKFSVQYGDHSEAMTKIVAELKQARSCRLSFVITL